MDDKTAPDQVAEKLAEVAKKLTNGDIAGAVDDLEDVAASEPSK